MAISGRGSGDLLIAHKNTNHEIAKTERAVATPICVER